jgi:hypothetical protein
VKLYFDPLLIHKKLLTDIEEFFMMNISINDVDELGETYIKRIDGAIIADRASRAILTPYGITELDNLSTGAKTVLVIMHIAKNKLDYAVDVNECGENALNCIFDFLERNDNCVPILLSHIMIRKCDDHEFFADDTNYCKNKLELMIYGCRKVFDE